MNKALTQQQIEMLERFKRLKVGALFSQMGTGKTRVAIELVNYNSPDFLLYICPFSCKDNIEKELQKWGVSCPYQIVGYETLSASDKTYMQVRAELAKHEKNFIIADESIFIKNGRTKRNRRCMDLRSLCKWALVLNGTPIVNNERDIYNQMEFLSHDIFKMRYGQFMETFFVDHCIRKRGTHKNVDLHFYTFYEPNRPAFSKIIAPYIYMADLIFQHEVSEHYCWCQIDTEKYYETKERILSRYIDYDTDSIIALFTALASVAAEDKKKNQKVIDYITGKKCIVYGSRKEEIRQIAAGCDCFVIDGETKAEDRKRIIEEFTACEDKPLILSFGVGAYSLNLQTANEIVYSSLTFNFGQFEQSQFRIKRLGQESDIEYTYILPDCGISREMIGNLEGKESLDALIKRHIKDGDAKAWIESI